ncbi:hypothetical protein LSH36_375g06000 [Paralvinella palmiformis]|uniref:Peptidyl-prolyl cis-trans isomerase n=1 Tax=Paralvinella palmiformis TaxID=53620 RepID=A0AAD9N126_9ANNE|nr:hypothetical protein LSH36_375g06000 [Paralvinella palmiformis]
MKLLLLGTLITMVTECYCGLYTVTEDVWFEIRVQDMDGPGMDYTGRFTVSVFGETVPMTALNFISLAKGFKRGEKFLHYKGTKIHRVVPDFVVQMGDVTNSDGTSGESIYGERFNDENFLLSHRSSGWVAMANHGRDTNGSQFYILLTKARWLDGKHVVFGKVTQGFDVIQVLGEVPSDPNTALPNKTIEVIDSGIIGLTKKYDLTEAQLDETGDL